MDLIDTTLNSSPEECESIPLIKNTSAANWCHTMMPVTNTSYLWTIEKCCFIDVKLGASITSSTFSTASADEVVLWRLKLYPNGSVKENEGFLSLFLSSASQIKTKVKTNFKFAIIDSSKTEFNVCKGSNEFGNASSWGFPNYIERNSVLDPKNSLLTTGKLTLYCEVSSFSKHVNIFGERSNDFKIPNSRMTLDYEALLESQSYCDVTLAIDKQKIKVHKIVLAARSPVFAAMFAHDMEETKHNKVVIEDMDPDVMQELIRYIYTDRAPKSKKMTKALFVAADKYAIYRLKAMCEDALSRCLNIENFTELLLMADLHNSFLLKSRVIEFICMHWREVMGTSCWTSMTKSHPHLAAEVLQAFAKQLISDNFSPKT